MVDDLIVRDVMTREYVGVSESDSVGDAAALMLDEGESVIAVLRGQEPVGMASARDLLRAYVTDRDPDTDRMDTIMERPPQLVRPDQRLADAAAILADADVAHVFVSDGSDLLGVLSETDIVTAVTSLLATLDETPTDERFPEQRVDAELAESSMSTQSVCELCGSLNADLEEVNGQLICSNCRSMEA